MAPLKEYLTIDKIRDKTHLESSCTLKSDRKDGKNGKRFRKIERFKRHKLRFYG